MSTLTIRLPDAKHERLRGLAQSMDMSMNRLFDEWATVALAQHDAISRYKILADKGSPEKGLHLLDTIDKRFSSITPYSVTP